MQMRALTELCLFAEAVKESGELIQGRGILLPYGQHVAISSRQVCSYLLSSHFFLLYAIPVLHFSVNSVCPTLYFYLYCAASEDIPQQQVSPGQC